MGVLLLAENIIGQLATDSTSKALAAVAELGPVTVLIAGTGADVRGLEPGRESHAEPVAVAAATQLVNGGNRRAQAMASR